MYKMFNCGKRFASAEFVRHLRHYGVNAMVTNRGIVFDADAFSQLPGWNMSHFMFMNRNYLTSDHHTTPAKISDIR